MRAPSGATQVTSPTAGKEAERLALQPRSDGTLELRHIDKQFAKKLALLRETMIRYRHALRALAGDGP